MGFLEVLSLILIAAKVFGLADISWLTAFSPLLISAVIWLSAALYIFTKIK